MPKITWYDFKIATPREDGEYFVTHRTLREEGGDTEDDELAVIATKGFDAGKRVVSKRQYNHFNNSFSGLMKDNTLYWAPITLPPPKED